MSSAVCEAIAVNKLIDGNRDLIDRAMILFNLDCHFGSYKYNVPKAFLMIGAKGLAYAARHFDPDKHRQGFRRYAINEIEYRVARFIRTSPRYRDRGFLTDDRQGRRPPVKSIHKVGDHVNARPNIVKCPGVITEPAPRLISKWDWEYSVLLETGYRCTCLERDLSPAA